MLRRRNQVSRLHPTAVHLDADAARVGGGSIVGGDGAELELRVYRSSRTTVPATERCADHPARRRTGAMTDTLHPRVSIKLTFQRTSPRPIPAHEVEEAVAAMFDAVEQATSLAVS